MITVLNFDDIIRSKKKEHYKNGGKIGTCEITWDSNGESILKRFGVKDGDTYLGAIHYFK